MEADDLDAAFVFYWVAFNAAYAEDHAGAYEDSERNARNNFMGRVAALDRGMGISPPVWGRLVNPIRRLLNNRYVFQPFWHYHNQVPGYENWEESFEASKEAAEQAMRAGDTHVVLIRLFDRLAVLRNQLLHGGATWNGSVNRRQVSDGAMIMAFLVPLFLNLILDHPEETWGAPYYPVVDDQEH